MAEWLKAEDKEIQMAFEGLFKTSEQVALEERQKRMKGLSGWGAVGGALGGLFRGPSDIELRAAELDKIGNDLKASFDSDPKTPSWDSLGYTNQLMFGEQVMRKAGYGTEADVLFDERKKRREFERSEAAEKRAAQAKKATGKGPSVAQLGSSISNIKKWMQGVTDEMNEDTTFFDFSWNPKQTKKIETAFGILQKIPDMSEAAASSILRDYVKQDEDPIDPELDFDLDSFIKFMDKEYGKKTQKKDTEGYTDVSKTPTDKPVSKY